jgi:hypothetical protein
MNSRKPVTFLAAAARWFFCHAPPMRRKNRVIEILHYGPTKVNHFQEIFRYFLTIKKKSGDSVNGIAVFSWYLTS